MIDLKPCPFCGGKAKVRISESNSIRATRKLINGEWYLFASLYVGCEKCGARTADYQIRTKKNPLDIKTPASEAWNMRITDEMEDVLEL